MVPKGGDDPTTWPVGWGCPLNRGDFPERFKTIEEARTFFSEFFSWHQYEHHHSGIALVTPADVHEGYAETITQRRAKVLKGLNRPGFYGDPVICQSSDCQTSFEHSRELRIRLATSFQSRSEVACC